MIRINKIEFKNYRQYKSIVVSFDENSEHDLHILRAKNGTGKTTFLNGILWCLYAHEHYLNDADKALPIVNNSVVQATVKGSPIEVMVKITVTNDNTILVFERIQTFYTKVDANGVKSAYEGASKLKVSITDTMDNSNTKVIEDDFEVQSLVKQYFDESIYDYYFFDGENLRSYFAKGKSERIKNSIFNISQVTLLSNASEHARTMEQECSRSARKLLGKTGPSITEEIRELECKIADLESENRKINDELPLWKQKFADADTALREYTPIRLNIKKRAELEDDVHGLENDLLIIQAKKKELIVKYLTLLNLYPRVKKTYDLIVEKQSNGSLPPNIDKDQIQRLLNDHSRFCPVCNGVLDERAVNHLKQVLEQLDVSSATSNYLMEIKGALEIIIEECETFKSTMQDVLDQEKFLMSEINKKAEEAARISGFLAKYSDSDQKFDVQKAERERNDALDHMDVLKSRLTLNEGYLETLKADLASKIKSREDEEKKTGKKDLLTQQAQVLRTVTSRLDFIQNAIMLEIKSRIESQTWRRFSSMIWKQNTFGNVTISDNYEISVYNITNNEMTGSLSATEYMALAYSFTLAIHDASGKNCPLVVDSPLGRVSDENRSKMAKELLKVSASKQIIMLFTPDEYSDEVSAIYDQGAASIRDIYLTSTEDEIGAIGV